MAQGIEIGMVPLEESAALSGAETGVMLVSPEWLEEKWNEE